MARRKPHHGTLDDAGVERLYDLLAAAITPRCELDFTTPFELLVAVALSAHTTDRSVNAATRLLFPVANTPQAILALGTEGVIPYLRPVGLYNTKAKNLIAMCRLLIERHGGQVPHDREALEALPGVGRKTANVVLNIAFGEPTIPVDTHVHRVANRTGIAATTSVERTEQVLLERTPERHRRDAHALLILHGRYTCVARRPECWRCPVAEVCRYPDKELVPPATAKPPVIGPPAPRPPRIPGATKAARVRARRPRRGVR